MTKRDRQFKREFPYGMPDLTRLDLPPELLLLLALLRSASKQEAEAEIQSFSRQPVEWPSFSALIDRHGVASLVHSKLRAWDLTFVPDQFRTQIRERYRNNGLHALRLATEFARLSRLFETRDIAALPLKGFALSIQAYGDLSARHAGDLDILTSPEQADRAAEILTEEGYVSVDHYGDQTPRRRNKIKQFRNHFVHWNPEKKIRVESHWRFHDSRFLYPVEFGDLLKRSVTVTVGDWQIRTMSIEDTLLFILLHGASHTWSHLFWLCDLARIIERNQGLNWSRLVEMAGELNISRPLALGLILSHCLLNSSLPMELFEATKLDPVTRSLLDSSIQAIGRQDPFPASFVGRIQDVAYQMKLSGSLAYKIDQIGSRLLDVDGWTSVPLPDALFPLYYLLGPVTWLSRNIRKRGVNKQ